MEIQEENPLQINKRTPTTMIGTKLKNNIGRPKKNSEIKFTPQPKSIISVLLSKEQTKLDEDNQSFKSDEKLCLNTLEKKKWTCKECIDRTQYSENEYHKHILSHKNLHTCDYESCTYTTKFSSNLKTHKRIHTLERPYACDECVFRSNFISSLKTHKRLHRQERPFVCQYCNYKCNSGSNLKKHSFRKHYNTIKI